jgi:hypothetical protein
MGGSKEDNRPVQRRSWGAQTGEPEQRRNGMSIISTYEAGDTAKWKATSSFGAELVVRDREFIDA